MTGTHIAPGSQFARARSFLCVEHFHVDLRLSFDFYESDSPPLRCLENGGPALALLAGPTLRRLYNDPACC